MNIKAVITNRQATFLLVAALVFAGMAVAVIIREAVGMVGASDRLPDLTPVVASQVEPRTFADITKAVGTAKANESVSVRSKVSDTITRIQFDSGDYVEEGQILLELMNTEVAATLNEARATLAEAKRRRERITELTQSDFASRQTVDEAQAETERAEAQISAIEARLADRLVRAPFSGVVGLRNVSVGEQIDSGMVIATLNDIDTIKLDFDLPERFLSSLAQGQVVTAVSTAYSDQAFEGTVTHIDNQVDPRSRTVTVRAEIANPHGLLMPGMLLSVQVKRNERESLSIPESALMLMAEQGFVFVLEPLQDNQYRASRREVATGVRAGGYVEITEGLNPGDLIISEGTHRTQDGAHVRISEPQGKSNRSGGGSV